MALGWGPGGPIGGWGEEDYFRAVVVGVVGGGGGGRGW